MRELAAQFLTIAEKQRAIAPLMIGHRLMGVSMMSTGNSAQGREHYDQALALYDPAEHRPLATLFGQDVRVSVLSYRSRALWIVGYPKAALADTVHVLKDAREIGQAATLMHALCFTLHSLIHCRNYMEANAQCDELLALADERLLVLEGARNGAPRLRICLDRQSLRRRPNDHIGGRCSAVNWTNTVDAIVFIIFGENLRGPRPIRRRSALHWRSHDGNGDNTGEVA